MLSDNAGHSALPFVLVDYATHPADALAVNVIAFDRPDPLDLSGVTIWCQSRAAIHAIKLKLLHAAKAAGLPGLLFPDILTLEDWLWQRRAPARPVISETGKQLLLVEAIRHSPGLFQTHNVWPLARELVSLFNQCTLAQVPLAAGRQALKDVLVKGYDTPITQAGNISRESEIIYQLWQAYQEQIQAHDWIDPVAHYCQSLQRVPPATGQQRYYLLGKHRFSRLEALFLSALSQTHALAIYYPHISARQSATCHHPHIGAIKQSPEPDHALQARARVLNLIYARDKNTFARINAFKAEFADNPFTSWLSIFSCNSTEQHAHAVCLQARQWLLAKKYPIGIVVNDRLLARRIRAVLEQEGMAPGDLGGWALSTTSAASVIEALLDAIEKDFKKDALLDVLSSPFLPQAAHKDSSYIQQLYALKKLFKKHISRPGDSIDTFIALIKSFSSSSRSRYEDILSLCRLLKKAGAGLQRYCKQGEYQLCGFSQQLLALLNALGIEKTLTEDTAGAQLMDTLKTNLLSLTGNRIKISWREWRQWLHDLFENHYFIPDAGDYDITLCSLEHIDSLRFKTVIIAGVEDNRLTSSRSRYAFFSEKVRHELQLTTSQQLNAINFVRFRQLLEQCEQVLLSAEVETHGEPQALCAWVELIELFCRQAYSAGLQNIPLERLLAQKDHYQSRQLDGQFDKAHCPRPALAGDLMPSEISATQYQSLIDCPYQYFAKYVLALGQQQKDEEFAAAEFGKLVHRSLHEFHFDEHHKHRQQFSQDNRNQLIDELAALSTEIFMRAIFADTVKQGWLQRWLSNIEGYIDWALARSRDWQTLYGERKFTCQLNADVSLYGSIDRIDSRTDKYALIDYKTGGSPASNKSVLCGEVVQLPFYALLDERIRQVEYLYLGLQEGVKSVALIQDQELEDLKAEHRSRLHSLINELTSGAARLPAHGDASVCRVCDYQGLCRKAHWQQS